MRYGVAIDIGTTNIKMAKVCLESGKIVSEYHAKNSQRQFGSDVLSRIRNACEGKRDILTSLLREDICVGMRMLGLSEKEPTAIACNTTMMALLCGDSVEGMREFPFEAERLFVDGGTRAILAPAAGAFVGGDVVAGLSVLPNEPDSFLFIDIYRLRRHIF